MKYFKNAEGLSFHRQQTWSEDLARPLVSDDSASRAQENTWSPSETDPIYQLSACSVFPRCLQVCVHVNGTVYIKQKNCSTLAAGGWYTDLNLVDYVIRKRNIKRPFVNKHLRLGSSWLV